MPAFSNSSALSTSEQLAYVRARIVSSGIIAIRRLPQSKFRSAFNFPPPSTLIGALLYPLLRDLEKKEIVYEILEMPNRPRMVSKLEIAPKSIVEKYKTLVKNVAINIIGENLIYGSLLKINWYDTHPKRMKAKQAATSLPFTLYYGNFDHAFNVIYLIDLNKLEAFNLSLKDVARAAYGVSRLGSRESVVYSDVVSFGHVQIKEAEETKTAYSFTLDNSKSIFGSYSLQQVSDWRVEVTNPEKAPKILVVYPKESVKVTGKLMAAEIEGDCIVVE